jgi:hypothetical protein
MFYADASKLLVCEAYVWVCVVVCLRSDWMDDEAAAAATAAADPGLVSCVFVCGLVKLCPMICLERATARICYRYVAIWSDRDECVRDECVCGCHPLLLALLPLHSHDQCTHIHLHTQQQHQLCHHLHLLIHTHSQPPIPHHIHTHREDSPLSHSSPLQERTKF